MSTNIIRDEQQLQEEYALAIEIYGEMNEDCRPLLPRLRHSKRLMEMIRVMNQQILPQLMSSTSDFAQLHQIICCSAAVNLRKQAA